MECNGAQYYNARRSGQISSPYYHKGRYPSNIRCLYKITAPKGYRIKLAFLDVDIDPSISCVSERLEVLSRNSTIGIFCGAQTPRPLLSHEGDNEIRLVFVTAARSKGGRGFKVSYKSAPHLDMCASNERECKNRNCYDVKKKCDGADDCGDGTDEEGCGYKPPYVTCGYQPIQPNRRYSAPDRMIGADKAKANSWPWHASLQSGIIEPNGHFCGGTLIDAQWVLTAARCFKNLPHAKNIRIILGSHKMFGTTKYQQVRVAERIIGFPDLQGDQVGKLASDDDLALIKLNAPVRFNDGVLPPCMAYSSLYTQQGWRCHATGWGEMSGAGFSDELQQLYCETKGTRECPHNDQTEVCGDCKGAAPCQGDAGGPMVCIFGSQWYLLGITSRTAKTNPLTGACTFKESKIIFTRIANRADWITQTINKYT